MIRFVNRYTTAIDCLPDSVFNCLDTETNMLMENTIMKRECYYPYHLGENTDRYQRVVALSFVNICETDKEDDLSSYGFKFIRETPNGWKMWGR